MREDLIALFREFTRCWPWLEAALKTFPVETHRKEHVWVALEKGECQLWWNDTAAAVSEITIYPTGLRALNVWLAGGDMAGIREIDGRLDEFAREKNCTIRTVHGRKGWLRALDGYRETGAMMMKDVG